MKNTKLILGLSFVMAFTLAVYAGKPSGRTTTTTTTTGGFTFVYDVGPVTEYHAFAVVCQVGSVSTQPKGTKMLGQWWVKDLGAVTDVGSVYCPKPLTPKGTQATSLGILIFANVADIGGQPFKFPVAQVEIFTPKVLNGYASIEVMFPNGDGELLYFAPPSELSPFGWDFTGYLYDSTVF